MRLKKRSRAESFLILILTILMSIPVCAEQSTGNEASNLDMGLVSENVSFIIESNDVSFSEMDMYRLTYTRTTKRDGSTMGHVDIFPFMKKMTGYLPYGEYVVENIAYLGSMPGLYDIPVYTPSHFKLYTDKLVEVPFVIGKGDLSSIEGEPYMEDRLARTPVYTEDEFNSEDNANWQSPFVSESAFGDHKDEWEAYKKEMIEQGYMNEDGEYTDEAYRMMEELDKMTESDTGEENQEYEDGTYDNEPSDGTAEIETIHFDNEEDDENESEASKSSGIIPKILLGLIAVIVLCMFIFAGIILKRISNR